MRLIYKLVLLVSVLSLFFLLQNKKTSKYAPKHQTTKLSSKSVQIKEISEDANKSFFINADEIILEKEEFLTCKNTHFSIPAQLLHLYSPTTIFNTKTKDLFLNDNVTGKFNDINLKGSNLNYNFNSQIIKSDQQFVITHPQIEITGNKGELNIKDKKANLYDGVKSIISL